VAVVEMIAPAGAAFRRALVDQGVPQHNPLRKTLAYGAAVIGFAALGGVVIYFATAGLLYLRGNICHGNESFTWCRTKS
jgi:hypothetical protein